MTKATKKHAAAQPDNTPHLVARTAPRPVPSQGRGNQRGPERFDERP